jgi:membrane-bound lytic murein transglycosylase D
MFIMNNKYRARIFVSSLVLLSGFLLAPPCSALDPFPEYSCIESNILFWVDVYTKYPTSKGILHDSTDVGVIYDVIELWPPDKHGARKVNGKRIKIAKEKYKRVLAQLSRGEDKDPEAVRVARLFGPQANRSVFKKAVGNIRCQIGQSDRFQEGLLRSGAYIDDMKEIFRCNGLPEDLAYLPHVESSFNLEAHSKAGAAGIWQFTRSTGKRFMTVGYALDERCDPIRSTEAAAFLLKENYEKLGNWPMAITAYNHGMAGMWRAKRTKGSYEDVFSDYSSRRFKFASRNFYPEFLAARHVAKNYREYFGTLQLDEPLKTWELTMEGHASITDLSSHFDVDVETIRAFNPALRKPVLNQQKYVPQGYTLRLPAEDVEDPRLFSSELMQNIYKSHQKPSQFYQVKKGDTVSEIARAHGLTVSDLIAANNLDFKGTIYVNQKLRLPLPDRKPDETVSLRMTSIPNVEAPVVD